MIERAAAWLGSWTVTEDMTRAEGDTPGGVTPPPRRAAPAYVTADAAVTIGDVYRGIQIIGTAVSQLTMDQHRGHAQVTPAHPLVRQPQLGLAPSHFWEETALDLATCGNAYWRKLRGPGTVVVDLQKLDPREVHVSKHPDQDVPVYSWRGQEVLAGDLEHLKLFRRTGYPMGLGPIQAAQAELHGTLEARDYAATWMSTTDIPTGVLTTDQVVTPDQAKEAAALWRGDGEPVPHGHSIRVLGQGLRYAPLMLRPADVQFIETRQFSRTQLASLLGIPSSLLLAPVPQGSTNTYQNVEQEWIAFNRFTLMAYLRPMEVAVTAILPSGSDARFNVDALLRTDTLTRYQANEVAIRSFMTVNEVRAHEGLAPITGGDQLAPASTTPALEARP